MSYDLKMAHCQGRNIRQYNNKKHHNLVVFWYEQKPLLSCVYNAAGMTHLKIYESFSVLMVTLCTNQINIANVYFLTAQCVYVFCVDGKTNSVYLLYCASLLVFRRLRKIAKSGLISVRPSVCLYVWPSLRLSVLMETRFPLDGFLSNLIIEYFSKICRENSSFIKIWEKNGYFRRRLLVVCDSISLGCS